MLIGENRLKTLLKSENYSRNCYFSIAVREDMEAIFQLNSDELVTPLVDKIKALFDHEKIRISVTPVAEVQNTLKSGIRVSELSQFFDSLPRLSPENAEAFERDVAELRRMANAETIRDPWAS